MTVVELPAGQRLDSKPGGRVPRLAEDQAAGQFAMDFTARRVVAEAQLVFPRCHANRAGRPGRTPSRSSPRTA